MAAKIAIPGVNANSALFEMANSFGGVYAGLVSMAIIAAIWSTGPALLLIISTTLTRDFYKVFKPDVSDAQQVRFSKIAVVIVAAIFTIFGLNAGSILNQMLGASKSVLLSASYWQLRFSGRELQKMRRSGQCFWAVSLPLYGISREVRSELLRFGLRH
jgi:Na+/proline symporter